MYECMGRISAYQFAFARELRRKVGATTDMHGAGVSTMCNCVSQSVRVRHVLVRSFITFICLYFCTGLTKLHKPFYPTYADGHSKMTGCNRRSRPLSSRVRLCSLHSHKYQWTRATPPSIVIG